MNKFRTYKRDWLERQNHLALYNISKKRNIDISKYFTKVNERFLVNRETKSELIEAIIKSNIEYKDVIQTIIRIIAILIPLLGLLWGIYIFTQSKEQESINKPLTESPSFKDTLNILKSDTLSKIDTIRSKQEKIKTLK